MVISGLGVSPDSPPRSPKFLAGGSDDKRRGHDLEAEHTRGGRMLYLRPGERRCLRLRGWRRCGAIRPEIGAGPAARVEHIDILRRAPVRYAEIVLQRPVHAGDHVTNYRRRRVPDALRFLRPGSDALRNRSGELRHRLAFVEAGEELFSARAVEHGRPVYPAARPGRAVAGGRTGLHF